MDLQDPEKKMSKSDDNDKGYILLEDINRIKKKIKSAVTDSDSLVKYDLENKPGISNSMTIYSTLTDLSFNEIEQKYLDKGYGDFEGDLTQIVVDVIQPIQNKYLDIVHSTVLDDILDSGRDIASKIANKKITKINNKLGLGRKPR